MKKISILILCLSFIVACKENKEKTDDVKKEQNREEMVASFDVQYVSYGKMMRSENTISKELASEKFSSLKEGDTINLKFASSINEVCKSKGCWMKLDLGKGKESMVRFKDYGFFVPLDADNKEVIVNGKAYVTKTSVDQLKHYAKDGGKTVSEIAKIKEPEFTYAFEADGVLMKE